MLTKADLKEKKGGPSSTFEPVATGKKETGTGHLLPALDRSGKEKKEIEGEKRGKGRRERKRDGDVLSAFSTVIFRPCKKKGEGGEMKVTFSSLSFRSLARPCRGQHAPSHGGRKKEREKGRRNVRCDSCLFPIRREQPVGQQLNLREKKKSPPSTVPFGSSRGTRTSKSSRAKHLGERKGEKKRERRRERGRKQFGSGVEHEPSVQASKARLVGPAHLKKGKKREKTVPSNRRALLHLPLPRGV